MNVRTYTRDGDDIRPMLTVWLPTAFAAYLAVYKIADVLLRANGYGHTIPVELCGGGSCSTIQMVSAEYYAGPLGMTAMLLVLGAWVYRDSRE